MLRNNRCFLDPENILELTSPGEIKALPDEPIQDYEHLTTANILQILTKKILSSKVSFGACSNSYGLSGIADSDILYSLELGSESNRTEIFQFKLSIEDLISSLIETNKVYAMNSDKIEELILISNSLQQLSTKLKLFLDKNISLINEQLEKDTPSW